MKKPETSFLNPIGSFFFLPADDFIATPQLRLFKIHGFYPNAYSYFKRLLIENNTPSASLNYQKQLENDPTTQWNCVPKIGILTGNNHLKPDKQPCLFNRFLKK
ncbi:MAG: hypothetical protein FJ220_05240 [Kiritimatiellaceae bacterium]|nr:hypothetical protein [Kiritimatiellaceae bacterium]